MKTISYLKEQLAEIASIDLDTAHESELKAAKKNRIFLSACLHYVETNPRPEFIQKEIFRIDLKLKTAVNGFSMPYISDNDKIYRKIKREYEKEAGIPKMKEQLKTLRFLLK